MALQASLFILAISKPIPLRIPIDAHFGARRLGLLLYVWMTRSHLLLFVGAHVGLVWMTLWCAEMSINRDFYEQGIGLEIANMNRLACKTTVVHLRAQL